MNCIGLMGTIASGKTTVAFLFKNYNINIINTDKISRNLIDHNEYILYTIKKYFGNIIVDNNTGKLNRNRIREIIFTQSIKKEWLEKLLHPLIRKRILQQISKAQGKYCIIEMPIIRQHISYSYINYILLILSSKNKQVHRIMNRYKCSKKNALIILKSQPNAKKLKQYANDIIYNNKSIINLQKSVSTLYKKYKVLFN